MPSSKRNRTKGNVKPSSSSRAAELLSQSGATGFIGFGSLGGAQAYVPASQAFDDVDSCLDSEFRMVLRKLNKRDATTKIKALGEFSSLCREKDDATLQAVLPFWPRLFNKLAIDVDPRVREETQKAMAVLVGRVRRNLAPYLKNVMGVWILSRNDTYPTVASAANRSFSAAFPLEKQESAIVFCKQATLEYLTDNLINQTPESLSDPKTTEREDMDRKYRCVVSSSLLGLRQLLLVLPSSQVNDEVRGYLRGVLNLPKFWNQAKSQVTSENSALFWFLGSVCQVVPDVAEEYIKKIGPLVLGSVNITEPALIPALWNALLACIKFVPICWDSVSWQKAFWPKLKNVLQSGCHGNAANMAQNFLPLFSCVPMETAGGATVFFPRVLELFKEGFMADSVSRSPSETTAWVKAFMECMQFAFKHISTTGAQDSNHVLRAILLDQLLPVVEASLMDPKLSLSRSILYPTVAIFLSSVGSNPVTVTLAANFWSQLSSDLVDMLESMDCAEKQSLSPDRLVMFFRALLNPQDAAKSSGGGRRSSERVKFTSLKGEEEEEDRGVQAGKQASTDGSVEVCEDVKSMVKKVVAHCHRLYGRGRHSAHLKLFVDLANLYFPEDMAAFVLHSLESKSGEVTVEEQENIVVEGAHSKVIELVVLPVLGTRGREREEVEHSLTLLFACLPYLTKEASTQVWDSMLQTLDSTSALCSLIERALEKRHLMPQVSDWLRSPLLHTRICDLIATVTSQHSTLPPDELEQGWKIICLVLSANDDSEPVFPSSWVVDVVSSVGQELTSLASRPVAQQEVELVIHFVAKAALTFFQNLRVSLCIDEGRDVITALLLVDLDPSLSITGEAEVTLRQSWTTGLGLTVKETGGFLRENGTLASACHILRDTVMTRTYTLEQYIKVIEVTEALLKTVWDHLPREETEASNSGSGCESSNPLLTALVWELVVPFLASPTHNYKVAQHCTLTGKLPTIVQFYEKLLGSQPEEEGDHNQAMFRVVSSSLFNIYLLQCAHSQFKCRDSEDERDVDQIVDGGDDDEEEEEGESAKIIREDDRREEETVLDIMRSQCLASVWCDIESKVPPELTQAVEDMRAAADAYFASLSQCLQHSIIRRAFRSVSESMDYWLAFSHLAVLQYAHQGLSVQEFFSDLYLSCTAEDLVGCVMELLVPCLPQWQNGDLFHLHAAVLFSLGPKDLASERILACLRVLRAVVAKESAFISAQGHILQNVVTKVKAMRDDDDETTPVFLFSCDILERDPICGAVNVAIMQFLTAVVDSDSFKLTSDLWDFILCSLVSWVESLNFTHVSLQSPMMVQAFCVEACHLVTAVAIIMKYCGLKSDHYPPNLLTEWTELFSESIYSILFPLFVKLLDQLKNCQSSRGTMTDILKALGTTMSWCPQGQITSHSLPLLLSASEDLSPLPESLQTVFNHMCPALTYACPPAQVAAFEILSKIITLVHTYHRQQEEGTIAAGSNSAQDKSRAPPAALMKIIDDCATAMDVVLGEVPIETTILLVPGTEEYQFALGYLLSWQLLLQLFRTADSMGRTEYAAYLKEHSNVQLLLHHLFRLMPVSPVPSSSSSSSPSSSWIRRPHGEEVSPELESSQWGQEKSVSKPARCLADEEGGADSWFGSIDVPFKPMAVGKVNDIQRLSCSVYTFCLKAIPVLVRQWWKDQDRKTAAFVDKFTTKYVSQHLIQDEMDILNSPECDIRDVIVKANPITRQVTAVYMTQEPEDLIAEIQVTLPENFPLGEISVEAARHVVLKQAQWEKLLLQISMYLHHLNGQILEGVKLWKRNIEKKLEGLEECYICYAIVSGVNMELPRLPCNTCKKKFHSACLYKWWNSSQNSTCPLCRSSFS